MSSRRPDLEGTRYPKAPFRRPPKAEPATRPAASFLVRFWREPGDTAEGGVSVRGYVRNLKTGEERYLSSTEQLGAYIEEKLEDDAEDEPQAAPASAV